MVGSKNKLLKRESLFLTSIAAVLVIIAITASLAGTVKAQEMELSQSVAGSAIKYLAGLEIGPGSEPLVSILNPDSQTASAKITIFTEKDSSSSFDIVIPGNTVNLINLKDKIPKNPGTTFGMAVASESELVIAGIISDNAVSAGFGLQAQSLSKSLFFTEGASGSQGKTYLHILNPGNTDAELRLTLYYEGGQKKTLTLAARAGRHTTIDLDTKTQPDKRFGIKLSSNEPVLAVSNTYNRVHSSGTGDTGTGLSREWTLPDGFLSEDVREKIMILNPSMGDAQAVLSIFYDDGTSESKNLVIPSNGLEILNVDNLAQQLSWFSAIIESDIDIAVGSTHRSAKYSAAHGGGAVKDSLDRQCFAYGSAGNLAKSHIAIFNPSENDADILIEIFDNNGYSKKFTDIAVARARTTIDLNKKITGEDFFGVCLTSTEEIAAKQVVFDKRYSIGYGYNAVPISVISETAPASSESDGVQKQSESVVIPENFNSEADDESYIPAQKPTQDVQQESQTGIILVGNTMMDTSRLSPSILSGLQTAVREEYLNSGDKVLSFIFKYADEELASAALDEILAGAMFTITDSAKMTGLSAHSFDSEKTEGYIWQDGSAISIVAAEKSKGKKAFDLAEGRMLPEKKNNGTFLISFILIGALVILILIVRAVFRDKDDESVWEEMIPSSKPENKHVPGKTSVINKSAGTKMTRPANVVRQNLKKEHITEKNKIAPVKIDSADQKPIRKNDLSIQVKPITEVVTEKKHLVATEAAKEAVRKIKEMKASSMRDDASITKKMIFNRLPLKTTEKVTAQNILDELEDIPDYEDVFRHVNRDQEETHQK